MGKKKNLLYILIVLMVIAISFLYDNQEKESKEFTDIISKNIMAAPKEISTNQKVAEKPSNTKIAIVEKTLDGSNLKGVIKLGDSGYNVKYIQRRLVVYGYKLEVDGYFKALTYDAILNFQYRCKLDIDGVVGLKTLGKLNMTVAENVEFNSKKSASPINNKSNVKDATNVAITASQLESSINSLKVTSKTNYYIRVDLKNQRVNIFMKSKDKWVLDKSFLCSTGKASTPTVKGNFTIKDKGPMFRAGSNTICNYYTRFYGNYLFHTVLLDNKGNIQDGRLGTPLSHGCIRLAIDNAKYIYTNIPYGTGVSIQ